MDLASLPSYTTIDLTYCKGPLIASSSSSSRSSVASKYYSLLHVWLCHLELQCTSHWSEPERAPHYREFMPEILSVCTDRPAYLPLIAITAMTSSTKFRSLALILVPRTHLSFPGLHLRDSSRSWYGLPGRSVERSQASGSDKLAGGSKHTMVQASLANTVVTVSSWSLVSVTLWHLFSI